LEGLEESSRNTTRSSASLIRWRRIERRSRWLYFSQTSAGVGQDSGERVRAGERVVARDLMRGRKERREERGT
jgi:hypothetical protein